MRNEKQLAHAYRVVIINVIKIIIIILHSSASTRIQFTIAKITHKPPSYCCLLVCMLHVYCNVRKGAH